MSENWIKIIPPLSKSENNKWWTNKLPERSNKNDSDIEATFSYKLKRLEDDPFYAIACAAAGGIEDEEKFISLGQHLKTYFDQLAFYQGKKMKREMEMMRKRRNVRKYETT